MSITFDYGTEKIGNIRVEVIRPTTKKSKTAVSKIFVKDEEIVPTNRFWKSLRMLFKCNDTIFKYFSHEEVFNRISEVSAKATMRYCIERVEGQKPKMLAVTNPAKPYIQFDDLMEILNKHNSENKSYVSGMVRSTHIPSVPWNFEVAGDAFSTRFISDIPIDGFAKPNLFVSLLRQVCSNGAIGMAPAFRTELNVGKKDDAIAYVLNRALESFNNEDAYAAMKQRFDSAANSWASVGESMQLSKTIIKCYNAGQLKGVKKLILGGDSGNTYDDIPVMKKFSEMTGHLNHTYGLSNIDSLSDKKKRTLPAGCKVYDLLNFASELATHGTLPEGNRVLQGYIGSLITDDYDLEGTCEEYQDWRDFLVFNEKAIETKTQLDSLSH